MSVIIQSVNRALDILNTLAAYSDGLTNREIAEKVGLNVSTTHHLVNTLAAEGYVHRLDSSKYCLGHAIARLHSAYLSNISLHTHLYDALNKLAEVTRETAYLCVCHSGHALIQAIVEGSQAVRVGGLYVGFMGNTHLRASGKALLAYLDEQELDAYLATADFTPLTAKSVCDPEELKEQLQEVVKRGYAIDRGEFADDVNCAATPVFSAEGEVVAVLAISAPEQRFVRKEDQLISAVVQAASNASRMLGYKSSEQSDIETAPVRNEEVPIHGR
jgi:DNA-binding IclR family transcriptional regulator